MYVYICEGEDLGHVRLPCIHCGRVMSPSALVSFCVIAVIMCCPADKFYNTLYVGCCILITVKVLLC